MVLGQIFRSRQQIRTLAEKLLARSTKDKDKVKAIVDFLCSESGSHDYTINRREARSLGLDIEKPSEVFYRLLKDLHDNYSTEMKLRVPYDLSSLVTPGQTAQYMFSRAAIESATHGAHHFITEGTVSSLQIGAPPVAAPMPVPFPQIALQDQRTFEGWRKVA